MNVEKLTLKNFRSYNEKTVEFSKKVNVIYGKNAQGKTNLLEAIFFCAVTRSFRGANDKELTMFGEKNYNIELDFFSYDRPQNIKVDLKKGKKEFFLNGIKQNKRSDFVGTLQCVLFSPEHLALVKNGPGERRRFIDMSLCQLRPAYYSALSNYQKLLEQKNVLLKKMDGKESMRSLLSLYNEKLSGYCAKIITMRNEYLNKLELFAKEIHKSISDGSETLSLHYKTSPHILVNCDEKTMEAAIYEEFEKQATREMIMKTSLIGCHRDNFEIKINGYDAKIYGSQGQQRSCVLSLKMAECNIFKELYGEFPVLLLDDIMSELDSKRKDYIINHISDRQVIITCCEKDVFLQIKEATVIEIKKEKKQEEE